MKYRSYLSRCVSLPLFLTAILLSVFHIAPVRAADTATESSSTSIAVQSVEVDDKKVDLNEELLQMMMSIGQVTEVGLWLDHDLVLKGVSELWNDFGMESGSLYSREFVNSFQIEVSHKKILKIIFRAENGDLWVSFSKRFTEPDHLFTFSRNKEGVYCLNDLAKLIPVNRTENGESKEVLLSSQVVTDIQIRKMYLLFNDKPCLQVLKGVGIQDVVRESNYKGYAK